MINVETANGPIEGTGIIFGYDINYLYIATAYHVVRQGTRGNAAPINVSLNFQPGAIETSLDAGHDINTDIDLAFLKVRKPPRLQVKELFNHIKIYRDFDDITQVRDLYAIGNGWSLNDIPHVLKEIERSIISFEVGTRNFGKGFSGGGLFVTDKYELIGMVTEEGEKLSRGVTMDHILKEAQKKDRRYPINVFKDYENRKRKKAWPWLTGGVAAAAVACMVVDGCPPGPAEIADPPDRPVEQ